MLPFTHLLTVYWPQTYTHTHTHTEIVILLKVFSVIVNVNSPSIRVFLICRSLSLFMSWVCNDWLFQPGLSLLGRLMIREVKCVASRLVTNNHFTGFTYIFKGCKWWWKLLCVEDCLPNLIYLFIYFYLFIFFL